MNNPTYLEKPSVLQEIERHRWLESEKTGYDIGFDLASKDWVRRFAKTWIKNHSGLPLVSVDLTKITDKA